MKIDWYLQGILRHGLIHRQHPLAMLLLRDFKKSDARDSHNVLELERRGTGSKWKFINRMMGVV